MILLNGKQINITIFPDKTSQVWKLDNIGEYNSIYWVYESDAEIFWLLQLYNLLNEDSSVKKICTFCKTLPYGRQDKSISNYSTFALNTLLEILEPFVVTNKFDSFMVNDIHNTNSIPWWITNIIPNFAIEKLIQKNNYDIICFPDEGAANRGYNILNKKNIFLDKNRDQSTGQILGLIYNGVEELNEKNILIIDDICDGGATFIAASKLLYELGAKTVDLYTTHGIYSKGIDHVRSSGIKRIYNFDGEV